MKRLQQNNLTEKRKMLGIPFDKKTIENDK